MAIGFLRALSINSPQGAAFEIANQLGSLVGGKIDYMDILNGFEVAMAELGPDWENISQAIRKRSEEIANEVFNKFKDNIPKYILLQQQGQLQLVIYLPTGPASFGNRKDKMISVGHDVLLAVSAGGGRLFGLGVKTSKTGTNYDQFFRIDYWDSRPYFPQTPIAPSEANNFRPSVLPLHVHYHVGSDDKEHRTIWYKY